MVNSVTYPPKVDDVPKMNRYSDKRLYGIKETNPNTSYNYIRFRMAPYRDNMTRI